MMQVRSSRRREPSPVQLLFITLFSPSPQSLTFVLLLASACTGKSNRCYDEHELSEAADRKLRSHYPQPAEASPAAAAGSSPTCPVELYQQKDLPPHLSGRSLSPWRYV